MTVDKLGGSLEQERTEATEWRLSVASVYLGDSLEVGTWKDQPGYSVYELQYMKIDDQSQATAVLVQWGGREAGPLKLRALNALE